jgi:transposase
LSGDVLAMSGAERERIDVLRRVMRGELRQARAAELLGVGVRQAKRLVRGYRCEGEASVVSRRRGRPSNNRLDEAKLAAIEAALLARYADFGATLASEKLGEIEGVRVSKETVRQIQIRLGLWRPKRRRAKKIFQVRERRPRFGELIQIDGSPHDWFEGRGPRCTLIVFIDDATGRLTRLQFAPAETTKAYLQALEAHVLTHGVPLAFYSDRHGIFRVNAKEAQGGDGLTEFGRVAERLRIELIHATTPQAKGRVERANQTLQDRLIKEMRLAGVSSIDEAQAFADGFLERWNARFAVAPRQTEDAHRPWSGSKADLAEALARREERTLSKALTFSAGAIRYAVKTQGPGMALRGAKVTLLHMLDGTLRVRFKDRDLAFTPFKSLPVPPPVEDDKTLDARLDAVIARNPPSSTGRSRKGVDNGLARYGAVGARFAKPLSTPTQSTDRCQKRDISTSPEKGTSLLCLDTRWHPLATRGVSTQNRNVP